jgi:hypothetical protein
LASNTLSDFSAIWDKKTGVANARFLFGLSIPIEKISEPSHFARDPGADRMEMRAMLSPEEKFNPRPIKSRLTPRTALISLQQREQKPNSTR